MPWPMRDIQTNALRSDAGAREARTLRSLPYSFVISTCTLFTPTTQKTCANFVFTVDLPVPRCDTSRSRKYQKSACRLNLVEKNNDILWRNSHHPGGLIWLSHLINSIRCRRCCNYALLRIKISNPWSNWTCVPEIGHCPIFGGSPSYLSSRASYDLFAYSANPRAIRYTNCYWCHRIWRRNHIRLLQA